MNNVVVVIPTRNRTRELTRAIASIEAQTFVFKQIVIVDDYSTEETIDKNNEIYKKYEVIYNDTSRGAAYSRNLGVKNKSSEFVAFLDSDDEWLPNHLEESINAIEQSAADFSISWFFNCINGFDVLPSFVKVDQSNMIDFTRLLLGLKRFDARTSTMVFRKDVFDELKFDEKLRKHQDWDLFLRAIRHYKCAILQKPTVRLHVDTSRIRMSNSSNYRASFYFFRRHFRYMSLDTAFIFWLKRIYSSFQKYI